MEKYIIHGGKRLQGTVTISGAKNAALGIIAASVMTDEPVIIENVPEVDDTRVMFDAIRAMGGNVRMTDAHTAAVCGRDMDACSEGTESLRGIRAGYYFIGAMLGKYRKARVPVPGGCSIGARPIDQHIKGFKALGADITVENGVVTATARKLTGAHIYFDVVSVGATINVMLAACLAEGQTILENVAKEPHIVDVANFLNTMGASVRGAGTDTIRIRGVETLHKAQYAIIPDQIEAGTFMCMAAAVRGDIVVHNVIPKHLESVTAKLREMGNLVYEHDEDVEVIGQSRQRSTDIKTLPYPGFPTDMQPQMAAVLTLSRGTGTVTESIYEKRFAYADELARMGAHMSVRGNVATIDGTDTLKGARLVAPDLRAGAALVIAALSAEGESTVENICYILRGYENFDQKIRNIGGDICIDS